MTYPTQHELADMVRETGVPESLAMARVSLRLGISWSELNEIRAYGAVSPRTAQFWNMVRGQANA